MTLPLREYLAQRRADVQASIKALKAELAEIDAAEKALGAGAAEAARRRERGSSGTGRKTLKELAVEVLKDFPQGLEATGILEEIKRRYDMDVLRESMSPQLSRLAQDQVLVREGLKWMLAQPWMAVPPPQQKDETPDVGPSGVSENGPFFSDQGPFE